MKYSPKDIKTNLNKNQFKFKKKFGQNFIIDENVIKNIVDKADIDDRTLVIEVGPGAGSLTYALAQKAQKVIAFEIDKSLKETLEENISSYSNVNIIYEDFLKINLEDYVDKTLYKKVYLVANLPYYITTPILIKITEASISVDKIVIMVQKEVGERFKAEPRSKSYSSLSVFLNYYYNIKKLMDVSRNVFIPRPNVDSIVVLFEKKKNKIILNNEELFFKLVRNSFVHKRKTIKNNLKSYDLEKINKVLVKNGHSLSSRAEELPLEVFGEIANELS